jgi:hypothetical protein
MDIFNFRLRKFTFGNNGVEFIHDALIKYQAMTCSFTLLSFMHFGKPDLQADARLVLLGALLGCVHESVKDALHHLWLVLDRFMNTAFFINKRTKPLSDI